MRSSLCLLSEQSLILKRKGIVRFHSISFRFFY